MRARYDARKLPPIISIVRYPGRPVISVPEKGKQVPPDFLLRVCFHNEHVGHAQAPIASHTYEKYVKSPNSGCRKRSAAKGVRSLFFVFGTLSVTFRSLFLTLLSLFSSLFCQTPFAGLLLRQGDKC